MLELLFVIAIPDRTVESDVKCPVQLGKHMGFSLCSQPLSVIHLEDQLEPPYSLKSLVY